MPPKKNNNPNNTNTAQVENSGNSNVTINMDSTIRPRQTVQTNQPENESF